VLNSKVPDFHPKIAVPNILQTVRKLAIYAKTVDQIADFGVQLNPERSEASVFEGKIAARARPRGTRWFDCIG
jgi:hypothetical protein